jgi:hypothetical protein
MKTVLNAPDDEILLPFINFVVDIDRALIMDPYRDVSIAGCKLLHRICDIYKDLIKERGIYVIKALFYPMINSNSKSRIAAIKAMGKLLYCNPFKQAFQVMSLIMAWRDPNIVPLSDFFDPKIKLNYLARLSADKKDSVRKVFITQLGEWFTQLKDKWDHDRRILPYLLTGLFDKNEEI